MSIEVRNASPLLYCVRSPCLSVEQACGQVKESCSWVLTQKIK
jgi:hypothetical protein